MVKMYLIIFTNLLHSNIEKWAIINVLGLTVCSIFTVLDFSLEFVLSVNGIFKCRFTATLNKFLESL